MASPGRCESSAAQTVGTVTPREECAVARVCSAGMQRGGASSRPYAEAAASRRRGGISNKTELGWLALCALLEAALVDELELLPVVDPVRGLRVEQLGLEAPHVPALGRAVVVVERLRVGVLVHGVAL